jgi:hypothetical protein
MFINTFLGPWLWFTRISQEILWTISSAEEVRAEDSAVVPPALWWALNINHQMARHFWWENSQIFQYFHHFILVTKYIQVQFQDLLRKRGKNRYIYIFFFPSCSKYIPSIWISQFISHTWPGISTFHHRPETVVIRFLRRQEKLRELCGPYDVDMARVHKEDCERGKKVPFSLASGKRLRNELERSSMFNIWIYPLFLWWFSRAMLVYQVICWSFSSSMISVGLMARVYQFYGLNDQQIRELWSPSLW